MYQSCNFNTMLKEFTKKTSNITNFIGFLVNLGYRYKSTFGNEEWKNEVVELIDKANRGN